MAAYFQPRIIISKERILALLFSISPFLSLYILPLVGINAGYFPLMIILFLYFVLTIQVKAKTELFLPWKLFVCMACYIILNQIFNESEVYDPSKSNIANLTSFFAFIFLFIIVFGKKELIVNSYIEYVEAISVIMSVVVIIQCILYYGGGTTISTDRSFILPMKTLLSVEAKTYFLDSKWIYNGIFRPSAFFQEPAHFAQYCSIGLASLLLKKERGINKKSIVVTIGMVLTTSGLGIASTIFLWIVSFFVKEGKLNIRLIKRFLIGIPLAIAIFVLAFNMSTTFHSAIIRLFVASNGENSAIEGRLWSRVFLSNLRGSDALFGTGFKNIPVYGTNHTQYYMTGIIELIFCQGIVGLTLFIILYALLLWKAKKNNYRLSIIMILLFLPFFIGSACFSAQTLCRYLPFMFEYKNRQKMLEI